MWSCRHSEKEGGKKSNSRTIKCLVTPASCSHGGRRGTEVREAGFRLIHRLSLQIVCSSAHPRCKILLRPYTHKHTRPSLLVYSHLLSQNCSHSLLRWWEWVVSLRGTGTEHGKKRLRQCRTTHRSLARQERGRIFLLQSSPWPWTRGWIGEVWAMVRASRWNAFTSSRSKDTGNSDTDTPASLGLQGNRHKTQIRMKEICWYFPHEVVTSEAFHRNGDLGQRWTQNQICAGKFMK